MNDDDRIGYAFSRTFKWGGSGFFADSELRQEIAALLPKYKEMPHSLGVELWIMFHKRWPKFYLSGHYIENDLGGEFLNWMERG